MPYMNRLLIIACSQRKNPASGLLPAVDRYDGPAFRVLRKFLAQAPGEIPTVLIVSARYGLLDAQRRIPDYDCRMSAARARELRPQVLEAARHPLTAECWLEIGLCVGKQYRIALDGISSLIRDDLPLVVIGGGLGQRLTRLRAWLRQEIIEVARV
jgi:hypothetical protein